MLLLDLVNNSSMSSRKSAAQATLLHCLPKFTSSDLSIASATQWATCQTLSLTSRVPCRSFSDTSASAARSKPEMGSSQGLLARTISFDVDSGHLTNTQDSFSAKLLPFHTSWAAHPRHQDRPHSSDWAAQGLLQCALQSRLQYAALHWRIANVAFLAGATKKHVL